MKRTFIRMALAMVASISLGTSAANAELYRYGSAPGGWGIYAYTGAGGGIVRCIAAKSVDGRRLRITTDGSKWWIGINQVGGATTPGAIRIDNSVVNRAYKSDGQFSYVGIGAAVLTNLARGNWLTLSVGPYNIRTSLVGSRAAINVTKQCRARITMPGQGFSIRAAAQESAPAATGGNAPAIVDYGDDLETEDVPVMADPTPTTPTAPSAPVSTEPMGPGCPAPGAVVSEASETAVTVSFDVRLADTSLTLYWLDGTGTPTQLGPLVAGVQTLDGHVGDAFLARDAAGACYGGVMKVVPGLSSFIVQ